MFAIVLLILALITLTAGIGGCVTYVISALLVITASTLLWHDNGMLVGVICAFVLALRFITKAKVSE